jgi:hypothetical protein
MNCLRPIEHCGHDFESHSKHERLCTLFCVCAAPCVGRGLGTGWSPSKESYRLCIGLRNKKKVARAQQRAVEPLMNEWRRYCTWHSILLTGTCQTTWRRAQQWQMVCTNWGSNLVPSKYKAKGLCPCVAALNPVPRSPLNASAYCSTFVLSWD